MMTTEAIKILSLELSDSPSLNEFHCRKDALTDFFGWMLQVLLACLAFTCLVGK